MLSQKQKLRAIVGPTGVGKTKVAVEIAQKYGWELVSVDSRQVYKGMDIATGKDVALGDWLLVNDRPTLGIDGVLIHGLDLVEPDQPFSLADWLKIVLELLAEIEERGHQPLLVGGTGFYLDGLMGKVQTLNIPADLKLRDQLALLSVGQLQQKLIALNQTKFEQMNESDKSNPARLIRAIEIALSGALPQKFNEPRKISMLGLKLPDHQLQDKVKFRIEQMITDGLEQETRRLIDRYGAPMSSMTGIGYREMGRLIEGQISLDQALSQIQTRTEQYIKRQYTWFNAQEVTWVDVSSADSGALISTWCENPIQ